MGKKKHKVVEIISIVFVSQGIGADFARAYLSNVCVASELHRNGLGYAIIAKSKLIAKEWGKNSHFPLLHVYVVLFYYFRHPFYFSFPFFEQSSKTPNTTFGYRNNSVTSLKPFSSFPPILHHPATRAFAARLLKWMPFTKCLCSHDFFFLC